MAGQYRLGFLPLCTERYDLCIDRRSFFEPRWQRFEHFAQSPALADRAAMMGGYDLTSRGTVQWNGPA